MYLDTVMVLDLLSLEDQMRFQYDCTSSLSSPEDLYKEFHTNMSQFREPPPYPGPPKQSNQSGLRQSFSGSETSTDVSLSSTENLSSSQRQEPQGEETQTQQSCHSYDLSNTSDCDYSILARLGLSTAGLELKTPPAPQIYVTGNTSSANNIHGPHFATPPLAGMQGMQTIPTTSNYYVSSESGFSSASTSSSKLTIPDTGSNQNISLNSSMFSCDRSPNMSSNRQPASNFSSPTSVSSYNSSTIYANYPQWNSTGVLEPMSSYPHPPQFVNSPHMGMPMGQMLQQYATNLPPPPQYPGVPDILDQPELTRRSYEVLGKHEIPGSRSQPDLSHFRDAQPKYLGMLKNAGSGSENGSQKSLEQTLQEQSKILGIDQIFGQASQMVEVLTEENTALREKLAMVDRKVSKLQKFEIEIQKVHEAYEALVRSSKKREYLEAMMKKKYEEEIKGLKSMNLALICQLEETGIAVPDKVKLASLEPMDSSMANLIARHKEDLSLIEKQNRDIDALKVTIHEQREQIEILRNVQVNSARIEESQRQQIIAEYDEQIQKELASIKIAYEKKEQTEKQIRQKLERDVEHCRQHHAKLSVATLQSKAESKRELSAEVRRMLDDKEAKILQLEKELIKWKEQHLEESIRKLKLQESEMDLTPRLPQYEQATAGMNTETLINEAKADKLKQMEEVYQANRKVAELEASVKSLQSQLSEKESILRIYQRSPMTRSSSVHSIYCTPHHSPRPSMIATGSLSRQNSQEAAALLEVRHKKTGSTSALEAYSLVASQDDLFEKIQSLKSDSKSGSESEESPRTVWQV